jgi:hypothetical protein
MAVSVSRMILEERKTSGTVVLKAVVFSLPPTSVRSSRFCSAGLQVDLVYKGVVNKDKLAQGKDKVIISLKNEEIVVRTQVRI